MVAVTFALLGAAFGAFAEPEVATISLGRNPEPPLCVLPNGTVTFTWDIQHLTTPNYVHYQLEDPTRTIIIEQQDYPGSTGLNIVRNWVVPPGSAEGKYWIRVEYWSFEASNEANAEVTFYVCNETGSICLQKWEDVDLDNQCDPAGGLDAPVPNWWLCITTPQGDTFCLQTDANGQVCWTGLPLGVYTAFEPAVAGWHVASGASTYSVQVTANTPPVIFCNQQDQTATEKGSWGGVKSLFR